MRRIREYYTKTYRTLLTLHCGSDYYSTCSTHLGRGKVKRAIRMPQRLRHGHPAVRVEIEQPLNQVQEQLVVLRSRLDDACASALVHRD